MRPRPDVVFLILLLAALALRVQFASTRGYVHDEENTSIPLAQLISFDAETRNLPIRAVNHGALPAYIVKAGSTLAGTTPLGYRSAHVFVGLCTILLIYVLAKRHYGGVAAVWAAALVAFNEYSVVISSRATAHAPFLLFVALAIYVFCRFLATPRATWLYAAAAAAGLAFYCKEHAVLLLPAFGLMFFRRDYRGWLRRPHPYLAAGLFVLLILPDATWNMRANPTEARVTYGNRDAPQATYARHLDRIGGIAFSPYPLVFYGRRAVSEAYAAVTGRALDDNTPEYASMNPVLGLLLLGAVAATLLLGWRGRADAVTTFLLIYFGVVFGLFSLIRPGNPDGLDPVSWIWVDATMLPASVLAGARLAEVRGTRRAVLWIVSAGALGYAAIAVI